MLSPSLFILLSNNPNSVWKTDTTTMNSSDRLLKHCLKSLISCLKALTSYSVLTSVKVVLSFQFQKSLSKMSCSFSHEYRHMALEMLRMTLLFSLCSCVCFCLPPTPTPLPSPWSLIYRGYLQMGTLDTGSWPPSLVFSLFPPLFKIAPYSFSEHCPT